MADPILETRALTADYGAGPVLSDLTLALPEARFTALLGANGCGKSTLLACLAGLMTPRAGKVLLEGQDIAGLATKTRARQIAALAQNPQAPEGLRVEDLVRQGRYPHRSLLGSWSEADSAAVERALRLTAMTSLRDRTLDSLSGGQRQRAWLAMTLAQEGRVLLLDEPTSFLDLAHQIELLNLMRRLIRDEGLTVIAVLHDVNQAARYADHMVVLRNGGLLAEGLPQEVVTPETLSAAYEVKARIIPDPETGRPMMIPRCPE